MKERQFIKQSEKKWRNFEQDVKTKSKNPKKTSNLFVQITDDLSYARTYYPNRMVRKYLDGVSQVLLQRITKTQRSSVSSFLNFWTHTLPLELYRGRKSLRVSAILFLSCMALGVISSIYEPEFARVILGDSYINMTESNIESGDPMAVYKDFNEVEGFLQITINNITVAFYTFLFGIIAAIGSVFILMYNGIMVGAFQFFFIERGLFWESFLTIWQHGTLEISAIIIAGAAGITMGNGLLNTGIYSRLQSFKISGRRGLTIFLGTVPLFIIAGFIEGFLTRATDLNDIFRLAVIIVSLSFILYYYVWYPRFLFKNTDLEDVKEPVPLERKNEIEFSKGKIFNFNAILRMTVSLFLSRISHFAILFLFALLISYLSVENLDWNSIADRSYELDFWDMAFSFGWLVAESVWSMLSLALGVLVTSLLAHKMADRDKKSLLSYLSIPKLLLSASLFLLIYDINIWFLLVLAYLFLNYWSSVSDLKGQPKFPNLSNDSNSQEETKVQLNIMTNLSNLILLVLSCAGLTLLFLICFTLIKVRILDYYTSTLIEDIGARNYFSRYVWFVSCFMAFLVSHFLISLGNYYLFYSNTEKDYAFNLRARINNFIPKTNTSIGKD